MQLVYLRKYSATCYTILEVIHMGRTSAKVKNRWIEKSYDRVNLTLPKGELPILRERAEAAGMSVNNYIREAIARMASEDADSQLSND